MLLSVYYNILEVRDFSISIPYNMLRMWGISEFCWDTQNLPFIHFKLNGNFGIHCGFSQLCYCYLPLLAPSFLSIFLVHLIHGRRNKSLIFDATYPKCLMEQFMWVVNIFLLMFKRNWSIKWKVSSGYFAAKDLLIHLLKRWLDISNWVLSVRVNVYQLKSTSLLCAFYPQ